jgi:5-formyltetrahydrofolate cyclo-ligase
MKRLADAGVRLALPVAFERDQPLDFRAYDLGDRLEPDAYNIAAPTSAAPVVRPDLVITPLLAFDRKGGRMGQGGGHYDRTLALLRAEGPVFVLGLAYAGQEVADIPLEDHDQRLDAILTEKGYIEVE